MDWKLFPRRSFRLISGHWSPKIFHLYQSTQRGKLIFQNTFTQRVSFNTFSVGLRQDGAVAFRRDALAKPNWTASVIAVADCVMTRRHAAWRVLLDLFLAGGAVLSSYF